MPAAHLTCVAAARDEIDAVIRSYVAAGVRHIVGLRGDPIGGIGERYAPHPGGYHNGADLVAGIKRIADIEVSVSAYPEKHPDSPTVEADIDTLAAKVDAGACRAITQFFFDNDLYFRYLDRVRARGIAVPVVPGILPVQNFKQMRSFATRCGTRRFCRICREQQRSQLYPRPARAVARRRWGGGRRWRGASDLRADDRSLRLLAGEGRSRRA